MSLTRAATLLSLIAFGSASAQEQSEMTKRRTFSCNYQASRLHFEGNARRDFVARCLADDSTPGNAETSK